VIVSPAARAGHFDARLDRHNAMLVISSRTPFCDSARALIREGADSAATLVMRHQGAAHDALRARLAVAAGLTVADNRLGVPTFRRWIALQSDVARPPVAQIDVAATSLPETEAAQWAG
jgi:hypothetical protein